MGGIKTDLSIIRRKVVSQGVANVSGTSGGHRTVLRLELDEDSQEEERKGVSQGCRRSHGSRPG